MAYLLPDRVVLMKIIIALVSIGLFSTVATAQEPAATERIAGQVLKAVVIGGDTIPHIELKPVVILAPRIFGSRGEENRHRRLVHNVKRVYPFAKLAGQKFEYYSRILDTLPTEVEQRRLMRQVEKEIREEFEDDLVRLTVTQGHILIKLIDRETEHSSFEVLREFRGAFSAVFWQSFARIFGFNLRTKYDPEGADRQIEEIVLLIEEGII